LRCRARTAPSQHYCRAGARCGAAARTRLPTCVTCITAPFSKTRRMAAPLFRFANVTFAYYLVLPLPLRRTLLRTRPCTQLAYTAHSLQRYVRMQRAAPPHAAFCDYDPARAKQSRHSTGVAPHGSTYCCCRRLHTVSATRLLCLALRASGTAYISLPNISVVYFNTD